MQIRVVVVDDHALIREALTDLLTGAGIEVVGQCADGDEVEACAGRLRPDVVLMDLQMRQMDGLTSARAVLAAHPEVRVLILTGALSAETVREARAIGVAGYLLKDDDPDRLPDHVRAVAAGGTAWHPRALAHAGDRDDREPTAPGQPIGERAIGPPGRRD